MDRTIKRLKLGQYIKMRVDGKLRKCCVTDIFDHFVRARYLSGGQIYETSFNLGELVQAGYEPKGAI